MAIASSTSLVAKCLPAYGLGNSVCGGLTQLDLSATTMDELASIYQDGSSKFRIMGALLTSDFMGKACQIRQNGMYDYLMATARQAWNKKVGTSPVNGAHEVNPFVIMGRKGIINNNYWNATNGAATPGTSPGGLPYDYVVDLTSQTSIPSDLRWFPPRTEIYITGQAVDGTVTRTQWTVVDATILNATTARVYATSVNTASFLSGAKLAAPATGLAVRGVPNVNPYESYCGQIPGINANQKAWFWIQDTRWSMCSDEMTEKYLQMLRDNNPLFREFGDVESVELNRQILADFQRKHVETFFWNKPLPNQTPTTWNALNIILASDGQPAGDFLYLPQIEGRQVARRANAVGIYEQLAECGRVYDLQGNILNIPELLKQLYIIMRTRADNGINDRVIEVITSTFYAKQLKQGLFRYLQNVYEGALRANMDISQPNKVQVSPMGFYYTDYALDYPEGVTLRIVTHHTFDDLLSAQITQDSTKAAASRVMLILDLGNTIYQSILQSDSVKLQTGDIQTLASINEDAFCRMKVPRKSITQNSLKFTTVVECPNASLWIEGIGEGIPEATNYSADGITTDLFGAAA